MIPEEIEDEFEDHDEEEQDDDVEELGEPTLKLVDSDDTACLNCGHETDGESACDHCGAILFDEGDGDNLLDDSSSDDMDSY